MKLVFAIVLILTHLFSTVGFSMDVHVCGRKKGYSIYGIEINGHCGCNHKNVKHANNCCKNKKTHEKKNYQ